MSDPKPQDALLLEPQPMRALSLTRPWPWAILHAGKRIENRDWMPPKHIVGETIALHAARSWDIYAPETIDDASWVNLERPSDLRCPKEKADHAHTCIVATARITGFVTERNFSERLPIAQQAWFMGAYGWVLEEVKPLREPVTCKGALGLWRLPPDVEKRVLERLV